MSREQNSSTEAVEFTNPEFLSVFKRYVESAGGVIPSLRGFYAFDQEYLIKNSPASNVEATWLNRFNYAIKELQIQKFSKSQPNWAKIIKNLDQQRASDNEPEASDSTESAITASLVSPSSRGTKRARSLTQTAKTDSWPLTDEARARFDKDFMAMKDDEKWLLRENDDGTKVYLEDLMYEFGKDCPNEHAVHSFIFNPTDDCWKNTRITDDDIRDILRTGSAELPSLDPAVESIFKSCTDAMSSLPQEATYEEYVRALWQSVTKFGFFDPWESPQQEWVQRSLLDYVSLYRNRALTDIINNGSEQDFIIRLWSNIDRCFEDLATVGRDRTCKSTLLRLNGERKVSGLKPIEDQQPSVRPDFLLMKDGLDFAVGECGRDDLAGVTKKEIIERQLHVPKVMKDILLNALKKGDEKKSLTRGLKVAAINENGTRVQVSVLDCPKGYVCRLLNTNNYEVPENPKLIPAQLFPILKLALQVKTIVKKSIDCVNEQQCKEAANVTPSFLYQINKTDTIHLPPSFIIPNTKKSKTA